jgi:hypothetical protein
LHACSSYELQSVAEKSAAVGDSPEYEVIPAFSVANNPTVQSNIAYGTIQPPGGNNPTAAVSDIQQQEHEARRGDKKIPAMQEFIVVANSPQDSGSVSSGTQAHAHEINKEEFEESAYDEI